MKRRLSRKPVGLGVGGVIAAGLLSTACVATAASATTVNAAGQSRGPSWHAILSLPNGKTPGNAVDTVVATGQATGWAFLANSTVAYQRTGEVSWRKVAFPGKGGAVNLAGATGPDNVWAAYRNAGGTQLYRWNGRQWIVMRAFLGQVTGLSVLGTGDVWVFDGPQGVFHFNGRSWTRVASGLQGGYALSDRDVWAYSGTTIKHFNGSRWAAVNIAGLFPAKTPGQYTSPEVTGIIALAPNDVYAAGEGPVGPHSANGVILHYNGRTWSKAAKGGFLSAPGQQLAADGRGGLWLSAANVAGPPLLFRYSAGRVAIVYLPGAGTLPTASDSVSRIPGTAEVITGGSVYNASNPAANRSVVFQYS